MAHHHRSTSIPDSLPSNNITIRLHRPLAPHRAKRGGGGRFNGRGWYSSVSLPKRAINYDLAESFVDHSTNPLLSDLYRIKFKHSTKQWPGGRFKTYKERLDKDNGSVIEINCTRTYPTVAKRMRIQRSEASTSSFTPSPLLIDPKTQEHKKKLADQQTNFYNNFLGGTRIPKISPTTIQVKQSASLISPTTLAQNKEDRLY